jgi:hypothetical protein
MMQYNGDNKFGVETREPWGVQEWGDFVVGMSILVALVGMLIYDFCHPI